MSQTGSRAGAGGLSPGRTNQLVLARHGRTPLNAENRLRGHLDPELDDTGLAEADALAAALSAGQVIRVVSSPLLLYDLDPGLGPADLIPQGTACWNLMHWRSPG